MPILTEFLLIKTNGNNELHDLTPYAIDFVTKKEVQNACLTVSVVGSTASILSMEFEPGLNKDLPMILEKLIPVGLEYFHNKKWEDDNAFAHIRSALVGNARSFAVYNGEIQIGNWQQIVLADFDNKSRVRKVALQLIY